MCINLLINNNSSNNNNKHEITNNKKWQEGEGSRRESSEYCKKGFCSHFLLCSTAMVTKLFVCAVKTVCVGGGGGVAELFVCSQIK